MSVQLAFGLTTAPGTRCWLPTAAPVEDRSGAHPPGAPVVVGPADATPVAVRAAVRELLPLTEAAAAGIDLGGGFTSACLAGAPGDRRDAVLAGLRLLGADGAHRLGDRNAVLVALFGTSATKRVGAAAHTAVGERQWAALGLASAASDLLGPEQVEQLLALRAPAGTDPFGRGATSTVAEHLSRVLGGYPRPRRLTLVLSLWQELCERLAHREDLAGLAARQTGADRIDRLRERHGDHYDEAVLRELHQSFAGIPSLAEAARWQPPRQWAAAELRRLLHDAIAATALLRLARSVHEHGVPFAVRRHRAELEAADGCLSRNARNAAARRPENGYSHPARPGVYLHQILQSVGADRRITGKTETAVRTRLAMARNYGVVVLDAVVERLAVLDGRPLHECWDDCQPWQAGRLRQWRAVAGFTRAPGDWEQRPLADAHPDGPVATLDLRLAAEPEADPVAVEQPHDLLWLADLADALAPFHGLDRATARLGRAVPTLDYRTPPEDRRPDSVPLAVAELAQLVAFGAAPPPRCRSWSELVAGVDAAIAVAEASTGFFPVPDQLSTVDKQVIPGTGLVAEIGREPRQLAAWSGYMGNCLGESWYHAQAQRGQCVLMALRDPADGRIVANLDLRRHTGGWYVYEVRGRFNDDADPELLARLKRWVAKLPVTVPEPLPAVPPVRARDGGRAGASRLPVRLTGALVAGVERELASARVASARRTYVALARHLGPHADFEPEAAVIALKRLGVAEHVELLRTALDAGLGAATLWRASRVQPLATAVCGLDGPGPLAPLAEDVPLPRSLRALVRRPELVPARALDVVARTVRAALGELVGDPVLGRSVARRPTPEMLCALAILATCSTVDGAVRVVAAGESAVPGFPASDLYDREGPWQQALPAAAELGAPVAELAGRGLLVPAALLGRGGWPALWQRAHR
ncbi:hypothetical protein JOF53_001328 [Crossiella equi]|uniref:Uncharacterized protein n=1 Tax=Crossiella equi TaxID=130796 RepID=A0ABS5A777_9PSEU|nr:hypothetical protein [Crossiella equi]MBP2472456.1 hypothetical protein [Crossiella equi]